MSLPQPPIITQEPHRANPFGVIAVIAGLVAIVAVGIFVYRCNKVVDELQKPETQALLDTTMMLALADEKVIRDNAVEVSPAELNADPMQYHQRWVKVSGTIEWLQSSGGEHLSRSQAQEEQDCVYWITGPVVVMDTADAKQIHAPGSSITAWGRTVVTTEDRFKHDAASQQALQGMAGYNPRQVVMLVAKWTELP